MSEVNIENLVLDCNRLALENLSKGNAKACLHLLKRAQDLLKTPDFPESRERLQIITFNNLGCYHKACQKYNLALQSFLKALDLKSDYLLDKHQAAEVHINICFIREIFAQYDNLVVHSKRALELLSQVPECKKGMVPLVYLYIGKGYLGLDNRKSAVLYLKQGLEISYKELGHSHPTTAELLKHYLTLTPEAGKVEEKKQIFQSFPSKASISSNKSQKKYVFEHNTSHFDSFFKVTVDKPGKKVSPVKADKRLIDGLYFEEIDNRHRIDRPCRHHHEVPTSAKSTRDSSKQNLSQSGRFTPDAAVRNRSSHSHRNDNGLPKIRASSSRPVYDQPSTRINKELSEHPINPSTPKKKKVYTQLTNDIPKPSTANSKSSLSQILQDLSTDSAKKPRKSINSPGLPPSGIYHEFTDDLIPKPPQEPLSRPKPPSSARSVHFRKPSSEIPKNSSNSVIPMQKQEKKTEYPILKILMIQRVWRGYLGRKCAKALRRQVMRIKAQKALDDLEELKKMVNLDSGEGDIGQINKGKSRKGSGKRELPVIIESKAEYSDEPIIRIQKHVRMFLQRKKYIRLKSAAIKVQSFIRMANVRELYINILSAIIFIQRTWRMIKNKPEHIYN